MIKMVQIIGKVGLEKHISETVYFQKDDVAFDGRLFYGDLRDCNNAWVNFHYYNSDRKEQYYVAAIGRGDPWNNTQTFMDRGVVSQRGSLAPNVPLLTGDVIKLYLSNRRIVPYEVRL